MKRYEIAEDNVRFGCLCKWYITENVAAVKAAKNVKHYYGATFFAAYFVRTVETVFDEMADLHPVYDVHETLAGPFATQEAAREWMAANC